MSSDRRLVIAVRVLAIGAALLLALVGYTIGVYRGRSAERVRSADELAAVRSKSNEILQGIIAARESARPQIDELATDLLLAAATDRSGRIAVTRITIIAGEKSFRTDSRAREAAEQRDAIAILNRLGLIERSSSGLQNRDEYLVTKNGYDFADTLGPKAMLLRRSVDGPDDATLAEFFLLPTELQDAFCRKIAEDSTSKPKRNPNMVQSDADIKVAENRAASAIEVKSAAYRRWADKLREDYQRADTSLEARRIMKTGLRHEFINLRTK